MYDVYRFKSSIKSKAGLKIEIICRDNNANTANLRFKCK